MADYMSKEQLIETINALTVDGEFSEQDAAYLINYILEKGEISASPRDLIQVRRGMKKDLPTLAQGELAYCYDSKELYVGGLNGNEKINTSTEYVYVTSYGAKGDGITDDTQAIRDAIAYAQTRLNVVLCFPPSDGFLTTQTIHIPRNINVLMESPIIHDGHQEILIIGNKNGNNHWINLTLNVKRKELSDWTNSNSIGIEIYNSVSNRINIINVYGSKYGVRFIGSGAGFAYNIVNLGDLRDNQYQVSLLSENNGWCNENVYHGGRFWNTTTTNPDKSRYGVVIDSIDGTYVNNNNNVFIKPSFELRAPDVGEALPILIANGSQNTFQFIRNENNTLPTVRTLNASTENDISTGYGGLTIDDQSIYPTNYIASHRETLMKHMQQVIFNSGDLRKAGQYNETSLHVPNVHIANSANTNVLVGANNITKTPTHIELPSSRGLGIFVGTENCKQFVVRKDTVFARGGRVYVQCFSADGSIINTEGSVRGYSNRVFSNLINFGGSFGITTDTSLDVFFRVTDEVKYIRVILSGGSQPLQIRSFTISTVAERTAPTWVGYTEVVKGANLAEIMPTEVVPVGTIYFNDKDGVLGWKYNSTGWVEI